MQRASLIGAVLALTAASAGRAQSPLESDWGHYGGDAYARRWSALAQVTRENVGQLAVAWTYRTGELGAGFASAGKLAFEATPVLAFGRLYLATPTNIVIAIDPDTGAERWRFDPRIDRARRYGEATSRGVAVWEDPDAKAPAACTRRVFAGTLDGRLLALDALTGRPCAGFGLDGIVDLKPGARVAPDGEYQVTSPPVAYRDTVVVGSAIGDNRAVELERGIVRGFDARSGALRWSFDPIPDSPQHPAADAWRPEQAARTGGANAWAPFSVDPGRGLVYVPTGSPSPDFFGGERAGDNRYANSLLAFEAQTGRLAWAQQLVRHDLWDYDLAAQPSLIELQLPEGPASAVIQATKTGELFAFDRETGAPLAPIAERAVPRSRVPGESPSPNQRFSTLPTLATHGPVKPEDAWGLTFWDRGRCRDLIARHRNEGLYTPPDTTGTILFPSYVGGVNWGGLAYDPRHERLFAVVNHMPMVVTLIPRAEFTPARRAEAPKHADFGAQRGTPFAMQRAPLLGPFGLPCVRPPWGSLASVDLRERRIVWQVPLGSTKGFAPAFVPVRDFGLPALGGPIATAGDLVFVAAAMDGYLRAFDLQTGRELWRHALPAGGQATPMTYRAGRDRRQYIVVAAGGHGGLGTRRGDYVVAFALPRAAGGSAP